MKKLLLTPLLVLGLLSCHKETIRPLSSVNDSFVSNTQDPNGGIPVTAPVVKVEAQIGIAPPNESSFEIVDYSVSGNYLHLFLDCIGQYSQKFHVYGSPFVNSTGAYPEREVRVIGSNQIVINDQHHDIILEIDLRKLSTSNKPGSKTILRIKDTKFIITYVREE